MFSQTILKIEIIRKNNSVCFEAEIDVELVPDEQACNFAMRYQTVIGFGTARLLEDEKEKMDALDVLMDHYSVSTSHEYRHKVFSKVAIIKIEIETMTGKRSRA